MQVINVEKLSCKFHKKNDANDIIDEQEVLSDININIEKGMFIAVLGHNGSGKSTFAKHLNALLIPSEGTVNINGLDTRDMNKLWEIRQKCGMVFQNPDNQIIGTTVEEDVAFGPENIGVESSEIRLRVSESLKNVEMEKFRNKSPMKLSGGQKQRTSIASTLAMKPDCIVLDEPTAMLDPGGRKEIMDVIKRLNKEEKITIILITHHMEEAINADEIFVINKGKIKLQGTPREVFSHVDEMRNMRMDVPQITIIANELYKKGIFTRNDILTIDEFTNEFIKINIQK